MSTTRSVTRWILLLTLAVVMLLSVSKVGAWGQPLTCLKKCTNFKVQRIQSCYEQMQRWKCNHAFVESYTVLQIFALKRKMSMKRKIVPAKQLL
ncbi:hypothetical protein NQZ68_027647 [Dissostichus eleginoides]|nr:hypothetical protein NQZ68_027647 [Dissostichus eleginoides]